MLAGVASGYDVRLSNVSPLHPRLQPNRYFLYFIFIDNNNQNMQSNCFCIVGCISRSPPTLYLTCITFNHIFIIHHLCIFYSQSFQESIMFLFYILCRPETASETPPWKALENQEYEYSSSSGYNHNTYHGPTKHYRPMLSGSQLMILQPEEAKPLRFTDSPLHHSNLTPNPSPRRKSSSTSNDGSELYAPYERNATIYIPGDYHVCQNEGGRCSGCCARPENSYRSDAVSYNYGQYPDHNYGGYSSEYSGSTTLYGYATDYAYDNPSSISSGGSRTPQRLPVHTHRRTPSNVSNASSTTTSGKKFFCILFLHVKLRMHSVLKISVSKTA